MKKIKKISQHIGLVGNVIDSINGTSTTDAVSQNQVKIINDKITANRSVIGNSSDSYSTSSTYALGSLVIYNSLLYKCTTAITVAEAWNSAKWTQVSLTSLAQSGDVYSTSEIKTNKIWIDGKPIYRKVVSYTGSLNSVNPPTNILIAHNISNASTVVDVRGFMTSFHRLPFLYQGAIINILYVNETNISLTVTNSNLGSRTLYFILEYTKTTD